MTDLYAGLDVSLELTNVCVVDGDGCLVRESRVGSDPETMAAELKRIGGGYVRVGLEAGPLSQWLYFGLKQVGLPAVCIEARHAKAAMVAMNRKRLDGSAPAASTLASVILSMVTRSLSFASAPCSTAERR